MSHLLEVKNLDVKFDTDEGRITAVENISLSVDQGEVLGIVGESGSGKSVTAKSIMKLNPRQYFLQRRRRNNFRQRKCSSIYL